MTTLKLSHDLYWPQNIDLTVLLVSSGYGFVDFDSPAAAQKAVAALKTTGVQAQMAKVSHSVTLFPLHLAGLAT